MQTFCYFMTVILLLASFVAFLFGVGAADSAPQQGATAGIACFLAIASRIFQAEAHFSINEELQKDIFNKTKELKDNKGV